MEQLTKNQAVATSQEAVQNQNEPQLRDENAHNDKSVHGVLNPTYQAGLRRDAVQPDIEAERKKRDEIEAGKSYCSRRFGGATCDDKSAQIYARFDKNDWRIQPAEFYRFQDRKSGSAGMPRPISYAVFCLKKKKIKIAAFHATYETLNEKAHANRRLPDHLTDAKNTLHTPRTLCTE